MKPLSHVFRVIADCQDKLADGIAAVNPEGDLGAQFTALHAAYSDDLARADTGIDMQRIEVEVDGEKRTGYAPSESARNLVTGKGDAQRMVAAFKTMEMAGDLLDEIFETIDTLVRFDASARTVKLALEAGGARIHTCAEHTRYAASIPDIDTAENLSKTLINELVRMRVDKLREAA